MNLLEKATSYEFRRLPEPFQTARFLVVLPTMPIVLFGLNFMVSDTAPNWVKRLF